MSKKAPITNFQIPGNNQFPVVCILRNDRNCTAYFGYWKLVIGDFLGMSLIELIISMSIFIILVSMIMVNYRGGERNTSVRLGADIVASTLRDAQTRTLAGALLPAEAVLAGQYPLGGYGVYIDSAFPEVVYLIADTDGDLLYEPETDQLLETIPLAGRSQHGILDTLSIVFSPPNADAYFNGLAESATESIDITAPNADVTRSVIIYRVSGRVQIQ